MAIIQNPTTEEGQIKFVMATRGIGEAAAKKVLQSIPFAEIYNDVLQGFERSFSKGMEKQLGQMQNALNPKNLGGVQKPDMAQSKETVKKFLKGNKVYEDNPLYKEAVFSPEYWDRKNAAIATATSMFGKNFVNEVGGFYPGGSKNEFKVDYIGGVTGQSQPQTLKINTSTGQVETGKLSPVQQKERTLSKTSYNMNEIKDILAKQGYTAPQIGQFLKQHSAEFQKGDYSSIGGTTGGDWAMGTEGGTMLEQGSAMPGTTGEVPPGVAGEAPPGTTYDEAGKLIFSTGNAALDEWLNGTWTKLMAAQFGDNPNAIFDDVTFKSIKESVDKTYGPIFQNELKMATDTYNLSKEGITAEETKLKEDVATERTRLGEDVALKRERIARNYAEAQEESKLAMAARKLTFGGTRQKEARKLETMKGEEIGDLERTQKRTLEDLTGQESYGKGVLGRQLTGLEQGFAKTKDEIAGEQTAQYQAELNRLREFGAQALEHPEFYGQFQTS